jgi:Fe-S-cluster-containing hydrogenase component 2
MRVTDERARECLVACPIDTILMQDLAADLLDARAKITNAYGVYITGFPRPEHVEGEDLAIRGDFEDRIVRVHWNGRVEVEQKP